MERRAKDQLQLQSKARDHIHQKDIGKKITPYAKEDIQNDDSASQLKEIHSNDNYDT